MSEQVQLSAPWITYCKELQALFGRDIAINIEVDEDAPAITLRVTDAEKAEALAQVLPTEKEFGNVTLAISVVPANDSFKPDISRYNVFECVFKNNPAFAFARKIEGIFTNPICYIVFKKEVVQFFNDDLSDVNGNATTLYQELAKNIFGQPNGVFFCTDAEAELNKPLGEWPSAEKIEEIKAQEAAENEPEDQEGIDAVEEVQENPAE